MNLMSRGLYYFKQEAVLCIFGILALISMIFVPPSMAYMNYIDFRVLALLFCLMAIVAGFQQCGLFLVLAQKLLSGSKNIRFLVLILVLLPFFSSMLITNDVALLTFVPFSITILALIKRRGYVVWVVVLQTVAANLGSMAMPVGNPQNLFLYAKFGLSIQDFFMTMLPLTAVSLAGICIAIFFGKQETISVRFTAPDSIREPKQLLLFSILFFICLLSVFRVIPVFILTGIVMIALLLFSKKLFKQADYALLLTFVCFFIFAGNIGHIEVISKFLTEILQKSTLLTSIFTSQFVSNVPAAVLLANFTEDWKGLIMGTNIGGLGTPIASLASLISLKLYIKSEKARPLYFMTIFSIANVVGLMVLIFFSIVVLQ